MSYSKKVLEKVLKDYGLLYVNGKEVLFISCGNGKVRVDMKNSTYFESEGNKNAK